MQCRIDIEVIVTDFYMQRHETPEFDCESIISTHSTLYNHPAKITDPPKARKGGRLPPTSNIIRAADPRTAKTTALEGKEKDAAHEAQGNIDGDDDDDDDDDDDTIILEPGQARNKVL